MDRHALAIEIDRKGAMADRALIKKFCASMNNPSITTIQPPPELLCPKLDLWEYTKTS